MKPLAEICVQTPPLETVQNSIDLHFFVPHLHNLANVIGNELGIYLPTISPLLDVILISCPEIADYLSVTIS